MTTKNAKVKISVALDQEIVDVLNQYSSVLGTPRSRILNDMLLEAVPSLKKVISSVKAVIDNPSSSDFESVLSDAQDTIFDFVNKVDG